MNEPIIHPIYLYLIDISERIATLSSFVAVILFVCSVILMIFFVSSFDEDISYFLNKEKRKKLSIAIPILVSSSAFFGFLSAMMPSRQGLISMIVANEITYERLDFAISSGVEIKEVIKSDLIEIFQSLDLREGGEND